MSSVIYTIGTALRMAADKDEWVEVLVQGHWLTGEVLAVDSQGLVLQSEGQQAVIQLSQISVVRLHQEEKVAQLPRRRFG